MTQEDAMREPWEVAYKAWQTRQYDVDEIQSTRRRDGFKAGFQAAQMFEAPASPAPVAAMTAIDALEWLQNTRLFYRRTEKDIQAACAVLSDALAAKDAEIASAEEALKLNQDEFARHMVQWNEMRAQVVALTEELARRSE